MNLDRERFLALAAVLFSSACPGARETPALVPIDLPAPPPPKPPVAAPVATAAPDEEPDDDIPMDEPPCSAAEGCGGYGAFATGCRFTGTVAAAKTPCNDDTGKAPSCDTLAKRRGAGFEVEVCNSHRNTMRPKVAERAIRCLEKLTPQGGACEVYQCGERALLGACPAADIEAFCKDATKICASKQNAVAECKRLASGLATAGRTLFKDCITTTKCQYGIYSCAEGL